jgi:hypothetical protein
VSESGPALMYAHGYLSRGMSAISHRYLCSFYPYVRYGKPIAESGNGLEYISLHIPSHKAREGEFQREGRRKEPGRGPGVCYGLLRNL